MSPVSADAPNVAPAVPDAHTATAHLNAGLRMHAARGSAAVVTGQGARLVLTFVATVILARLLTPGDFGLVAMVVAVTGFLALFRELGLSIATVQTAAISSREVTTLFWINVSGGVVLCLATVALSPGIAWFYGDPRLVLIGMALAPVALFSGAACQHRALLRRQMRFRVLAVIDVLAFAAGVTAAVLAAWGGAGYWALVLLPLVTEASTTVGVWVVCRWRPGERASLREVRRFLTVGGNITGFEVVNYWARNFDNVLIGRFWGAGQLGLYSRAYQLLLIPIELVAGPIGMVATSALSRVAADAPQQYRNAALRIVQKVALLTMPVAVLMIVASDWLVAVVLGAQWAGASRLVAIFGVAALTQSVGHTAGWLLITQGRTRDLFRWGFIGGGIALASIALGVPWGAVGVALSYAIGGLLVRTPALFWFVGRAGPIRAADYARSLLIPATAAGCALIAGISFRQVAGAVPPAAGLAGAVLVILCSMLAVLAVLPAGRVVLRDLVDLIGLATSRSRLAP